MVVAIIFRTNQFGTSQFKFWNRNNQCLARSYSLARRAKHELMSPSKRAGRHQNINEVHEQPFGGYAIQPTISLIENSPRGSNRLHKNIEFDRKYDKISPRTIRFPVWNRSRETLFSILMENCDFSKQNSNIFKNERNTHLICHPTRLKRN